MAEEYFSLLDLMQLAQIKVTALGLLLKRKNIPKSKKRRKVANIVMTSLKRAQLAQKLKRKKKVT